MQSKSSSSMQDNAGRVFGASIGNLFLAFFGLLWVVLGLVIGGKNLPLLYAGIGCFFLAIAAFSISGIRRAHPLLDRTEEGLARKKKLNRKFMWVNILQWGLIIVAANVLANLNLGDWILPAIIFIVGIHFVPLAKLFDRPIYYFVGPLMAAWGIVYPILFTAGKGGWIGAIGTGGILWVTAGVTAVQVFDLLRRIDTAAEGNGAMSGGTAHAQ
jgi:hypothetical protein